MARTAGRRGTTDGTTTRARHAAALVLAAVLGVAGCATGTGTDGTDGGTAPGSTPTTTDAAGSGSTLDGEWDLTSAQIDGAELTIPADTQPTLIVEGDRASGNAGCNTYTTAVDTTDGWSVQEPALTRMACEEDVMTFEQGFVDALLAVDSAQVVGDDLELTGPDVELTFAPAAG